MDELTPDELQEIEEKNVRKEKRKQLRIETLAKRVPDSTIDKKNTFYNGNPKLKKAGVALPFTQAQIEEYVKCKNDIIYFIKTYCQIVSLDEGLIPFELFPFQEEMINTFKDNRFTISLCGRQMGKCVVDKTAVKVRNTITGQIEYIEIGKLYKRLK